MIESNDKPRGILGTAFVMLAVMFSMWGLAYNMTGTLLQDFKRILGMSDIQETVIKSAFYVAYFFAVLPAVMYLYRHSYKNTVLVGLGFYAVGALLFYPAASMESYIAYLIAIYVMACGCAVLETIANPYIIINAPTHDDGVRNLSLAQSFNPLGSLLGILISRTLINGNINSVGATQNNPEVIREELDSITMLYAGVGEILLVFLVVFMFVNFPSIESVMVGRRRSAITRSLRRLGSNIDFKLGSVAMFIYVGAQTCVWAFTSQAIDEQGGYDSDMLFNWSMICFAASRFLFSWLMKYYRYQKLFVFATIGSLLLSLAVVFGSGIVVVVSLIGLSCMMSLMFATIYGIALDGTGNDMQTGGAILVMMISGGAVLPPLQGFLARIFNAQMSYIVPAVFFLSLVAYASYVVLHTDKRQDKKNIA